MRGGCIRRIPLSTMLHLRRPKRPSRRHGRLYLQTASADRRPLGADENRQPDVIGRVPQIPLGGPRSLDGAVVQAATMCRPAVIFIARGLGPIANGSHLTGYAALQATAARSGAAIWTAGPLPSSVPVSVRVTAQTV